MGVLVIAFKMYLVDLGFLYAQLWNLMGSIGWKNIWAASFLNRRTPDTGRTQCYDAILSDSSDSHSLVSCDDCTVFQVI